MSPATAARRLALQTERPSPGGTATVRIFTLKSLAVRTKLQASLRRLDLLIAEKCASSSVAR